MDLEQLSKAELIRLVEELQAGVLEPRESDMTALLHELQTYEVELEAQNQQLRSTQHELETSRDRYMELYDFAPVGFASLEPSGTVRRVNLATAVLLGCERSRVIGKSLLQFVHRESRSELREHLRRSLEGRIVCELRLKSEVPRYVQLVSTPRHSGPADARLIETALVDVSERKAAEMQLQRAYAGMEARVAERTAELVKTIEVLEAQMGSRVEAEAKLMRSQEQLRALSTRLISIQEDERSRIALEVHDELGQLLTALKIDLAWLNTRLEAGQPELKDKIEKMNGLVDSTVGVVRRIAARMRPRILDDFGLAAAVEAHLKEFGDRTGIACELTIRPQDLEVDSARSTAVFRIFQEALTNVARHAMARWVGVRLTARGGSLCLSVQDDGCGFRDRKLMDPGSLGLVGMRERVLPWGGELSIRSTQGKGTTVRVRIPLGDVEAPHSRGGPWADMTPS
jgi:PAS domain S-box-containing protein